MTQPDQSDIFRSNPELYRRLCEPFASQQMADESTRAFFAEVHAARIRYRIADVVIGASSVVTNGDKAQRVIGSVSFGSTLIADAITMHLAAPVAERMCAIMMTDAPDKTTPTEPK